MRRFGRILAWIAGVIIAIPVVLLVLLLILGNVGPGRRLIESLAASATGGSVRITGLAGRFPDHLRLARVELRDTDGLWLRVDGVALDWSPTALLARHALIQRLHVASIDVARLPAPSPAPAKPAKSSSGFSLPVRISVRQLGVPHIALGAPLAGRLVTLAASGSAEIASLQRGTAQLTLNEAGGEGVYAVSGRIDPAHIAATLRVREAPGGLIAGVAKLPALDGPIRVDATLDGPRNAEAATLAVQAGKLRADAHGTVDLVDHTMRAAVMAQAPAMAPRADLSWQSISINAQVQGAFTRPEARGTVRIAGLNAGGAGVGRLDMDVNGDAGQVALTASLDGLRLPGPKPDLLKAAPLTLSADARLDRPDRPVTFRVSHPLIQAQGTAKTGGDLAATVDLTLPDLQPLAAIGGQDIQGHTHVVARLMEQGSATHVSETHVPGTHVPGTRVPGTRVTVQGTVAVTGGRAPLPGLLGPDATIDAAVLLRGPDITIDHATVKGRTLSLAATGQDRNGALDLDWRVALSDLSVLASTLNGDLQAKGQVRGQQNDLALTADLDGHVGAPGLPRGPLSVHVTASGLPGHPDVALQGGGTLNGSRLALDATAQRGADGALQARIAHLDWKRTRITADVSLPAGARLPLGTASVRIGDLADFRPFIGQDISGQVRADLNSKRTDQGVTVGTLTLDVRDAGLPGKHVGRAAGTVRITDAAQPVVAADLRVDGIAIGAISGQATLAANGPENALGLRVHAGLHNLAGADATIATAATVNLPDKIVRLASLTADWHGESARLLQPAVIGFGTPVQVDRLRIGSGGAVLDVKGRVSPALDLTARLRNLTPSLAKPFAPDLQADGVISADAHLTGTPAQPGGTVTLSARGLHLRTGPAQGLPPANLQARADLHGASATLDVRLNAGRQTRLAVTGQAPLSATGPLALRSTGRVDLALLDPILTPAGRRARGTITVNLGVAGTAKAPRPTGSVRLAHGEVQDYIQGVHITGLAADLEANGDQLRIASLTGHAGDGTISAHGTVGVLQPGLPVNLAITASNARLLSADRLTADVDADLSVRGAVRGQLAAGGTVRVNRATVNVPDHLPASVAVLDVRKPGQKPPPPAAPGPDITLALHVIAPENAIFVRGHGLDAVLGGGLRISGKTSAPQIAGGFTMQRGTFSLAGTTLTFTHGRVSFDGTGVTGKIDPTLDFVAETTSGGVTARLLVGGYASAPKITLASEPQLPQDEVLAHLLFGVGTQQLGPFQIASIAQALASITGVGGGGSNPLDRIRNGLGLDRLSVGSNSGNSIANSIPNLNQRRSPNDTSNTTVEAGRYISNGVYVGAKQGTSGADTQAEVQVDITKRLKLETDLGTGPGGNNVGVTYQFEY